MNERGNHPCKLKHTKELYIVPGATHTDLYDGGENHVIPFDRIESFFRGALK